jgi:hypothetical protein
MKHQTDHFNLGKMDPDIIRLNMMLSSLYILGYELLRLSIVKGVKDFFVPQGEYSSEQIEEMKALDMRMSYLSEQMGQDLGQSGLETYLNQLNEFEQAVGKKFSTQENHLLLPCSRWLQAEGVITEADVEDISRIRDHRNEVIHETPRLLSDSGHNVDASLFVRACEILRKIDLFWFHNDVHLDPSTWEEIDTSQVPDEEILSGREAFLSLASRVVVEFADRFSSDQDSLT